MGNVCECVPKDQRERTNKADLVDKSSTTSKPLNEPPELLQETMIVKQESLQLEQTEKRTKLLPPDIEGETKSKEDSSKVNPPEDFNELKEELMKLVEEKNISELVRTLSETHPILKYDLDVEEDKIELKFEGNSKRMVLSYCSLNLDSINRISTEELAIVDVSFIRNGEKLAEVSVNEIIDTQRLKKLSIYCREGNSMSLDLNYESVSLEYLNLWGVNIQNWKESKWTVHTLELIGLPFAENTEMKVKEIILTNSPLIDLSCLPQTLEKLALGAPVEVRCTGMLELLNLKYLELFGPSNKILSLFSPLLSLTLTHLHCNMMEEDLNLDWIPKGVTHLKLTAAPMAAPQLDGCGDVLQLEKLILERFFVETVEEYLTHIQPKELVVSFLENLNYRNSKDLVKLVKTVIQRLAVCKIGYASPFSQQPDEKLSDFYIFEGETGKTISEEEFNDLKQLLKS